MLEIVTVDMDLYHVDNNISFIIIVALSLNFFINL